MRAPPRQGRLDLEECQGKLAGRHLGRRATGARLGLRLGAGLLGDREVTTWGLRRREVPAIRLAFERRRGLERIRYRKRGRRGRQE